MSSRASGILLAGILIVAAFFRLYHLPSAPPGLYPDEAVNAYNAATANRTGEYRAYYPENNGREGLFINIQAFTLRALGAIDPAYAREPWALRLPSAIFGILTVLGVFLLGRALFGDAAGLLAAFFAATSVWHIIFSRIGFRAVMAPFFLTYAFAFLMIAYLKLRDAGVVAGHGVRELKNAVVIAAARVRSYSRPIMLAAAGGVFFGLGFYSYIAYRAAPLILIPFAVYFRKEQGAWRVLAAFLAAAFIAALPIGLYYLNHPADFLGRASQVSVFSSQTPFRDLGANIAKTVAMFFVYGDPNWRHNYAGAPQLFLPVAILFAAGMWFALRERKQFPFAVLLAWLGATALPVVISNEGIPHALRAIVMFPPAMLIAGRAGVRMWDWLERRVAVSWRYALLGAFTALLALQAYYVYFTRWAPHPEVANAFAADYATLARRINDMPRDDAVYIIADGGGIDAMIWNPFEHKIERAGFPLASQVLMFMTDTFTPEEQYAKNIFYVAPRNEARIPEGAPKFVVR